MVLCKHFQQGYCRFGSKCNFEHLDIKQIVKNDIEGALNGKQYPFSCYGPFKDKPCVPNFIEDQSFEEVRFMCLEAKQKNCFEQFHQQFSLGVNEAMNKMKTFLQPSYEIMNVLTMIYDAPVATSNSGTSLGGSGATNPFGASNQSVGGTGSIFGKSNTTHTAPSTGSNVFGGGGGLFGGDSNANNTVQQTSSIFGGQNNFGTQQQTSIFGQSQQQSSGGSIFGGVTKSSLFNQSQTTVPTTGSGSGLFGQVAQQTASIFSQQSNFGQQQPQQLQQQIGQPHQSSGVFGQSFGQQQQQQNVGTFGSLQQQPQTQNLFGQSSAMQHPLGQQAGGMGTNIFAQAMQQSNIGAPAQGFFQEPGQQQQMGVPQMPTTQQQITPQQPQDLSGNYTPQPTVQSQMTNSIYSKLEELTAAEIESFKADMFEPGKIPFRPPTVELIN